MNNRITRWIPLAIVAAAAVGGYYAWMRFEKSDLPPGIASGNGRIEATEVDVSTKTAGRIRDILAQEGDFVRPGDVLARMDTLQLEAQRRQAEATLSQALIGVDTARSTVTQRQAEREAAAATVAQREASFDGAQRKLTRSEQLASSNVTTQQVLDDDRSNAESARAAVAAAKAQVAASDAAISTAKAQVIHQEAAVEAARASVASIEADLDDSTLKAVRPGRVQYRVAEPGEVLAAGGRVLNLVDLSDVYMTFFLPTAAAGRVAIGTDVRIVLDAAPQFAIPAKVAFVADVAQFTPKTVETEEERQKLMFRIKARIPQALLEKYIQQVKTGLPGMAYVRLDANAAWPATLPGVVQ
ncbi:HlyD family secretion protein [Rhizobium straminoryzae]|uniref:HlyD family efflux transporter periplasmic adaptor subunit n=1 Tax=Rhizobium straminoryzae TaxID=1387186 RepID=A0A549T9Y4_9HYPH|nr:HlyD family efflux transporter periplasmic adaptor subunit [Rhizobium straminoryzae]TRL38681.1 HlyD family efflux transporter periplasmic adaptor subunit [Rhizobium straminoryzae]